jgi:hypothetical protein|tara:strand:+ start:436 stop:963 length:528 start_codon:yes stop_codon:yes gene_type:complete
MALFGGERDMALFNKINKELITDIIDTEVYYYKIILDETKTNLYGEGKDKMYYNPVKIATLVDRTNAESQFDEFGTSYTRNVNFYFLRDLLKEKNILPELGDVIEWNDEQHIVDVTFQNQFFAGKNPATWDGGDTQGLSISIICETHVAKRSQLKLRDDFRVGVNKDNNDLPVGI